MTESEILGELEKKQAVVLLVDVVDSVRLIERSEASTIAAWNRVVACAEEHIEGQLHARIVKSLGDGLLIEVTNAANAVSCAFKLVEATRAESKGLSSLDQITIRLAANQCEIYISKLDIFGKGVNLVARLARHAEPNQLLATADLAHELVDGLHAHIVDLGEVMLKDIPRPTRVFRLEPPSSVFGEKRNGYAESDQLPSIAVMPMNSLGVAEQQVLGVAVAEEINALLSRTSDLLVISNLSSRALVGSNLPAERITDTLKVRYLVSGSIQSRSGETRVQIQLTDATQGRVVWAEAYSTKAQNFFELQDQLAQQAAQGLVKAVQTNELKAAQTQNWHSLTAYALLLRAIELMHRVTASDFDKAFELLQYVASKWPRMSAVHAWIGKWYVLRSAQGWSADATKDGQQAQQSVARALDIDSRNSLALSIDGLIAGYLLKDHSLAGERYALALDHNPNESLAWLFSSTLAAWQGRNKEAGDCADKALTLSPVDPLQYFYCSLAGTAQLAAGSYAKSIDLSKRSLRLNREHASTYRTLIIAQALNNELDQARATAAQLHKMQPEFSVNKFRQNYPGSDSIQINRWCDALSASGVPN